MTIGAFIQQSSTILNTADIPSGRLDCLVLLEDDLGKDRAYLLAHPETEIPHLTEVALNTKIAQRARHIPLAYIRGKASFYGRDFFVNEHVLVPRPETENMISMLKKLPLPESPHMADVGTGSGCLGITAALEINDAMVDLYDLSKKALDVAKRNAATCQAKVTFTESDLLQNYCKKSPDVILANLPYVPDAYPINQAASFEPPMALFAGKDGLILYRRFWRQIAKLPQPPAFVLTEALDGQHERLTRLAETVGYRLVQTDGLIQCFSH